MTDKLQIDIDQLKAALLELETGYKLRKEKIEQKQAEQRGSMVAARVLKDAKAKQVVEALSEELEGLQRESLQDYTAAEELRAQIETKEAELACKQHRAQHEGVLQVLQSRVKGSLEKRLVDLAKQMAVTASELADSDKRIVRALSSLGPAFYSEGSRIHYQAISRRNYISALLSEVVETPILRSYGETVGDPVPAVSRLISEIMLDVKEAANIGHEEAADQPSEAPAENPTTTAVGA